MAAAPPPPTPVDPNNLNNEGEGRNPGGGNNTGTGNSNPATQLINQVVQSDFIGGEIGDFEIRGGVKGALGGLPVAEQNQEYFAIIREAGDTSPELIDKTQFKVTYLCDSELNVSKPAEGSVALSNINQNFERQRNAILRVDQGTVLNPQLAGIHRIHAVGSVEPILGTQIGNRPLSYVTTMSFIQEGQLGADPGRTIESYYIWLQKSTGYQNVKLSTKNSGKIIFNYLPQGGGVIPYSPSNWGPGEPLANPISQSFTLSDVPFTSSVENPTLGFRAYQDIQQYPQTGSAVSPNHDPNAGNPGSVPAGFSTDDYFNKVTILTSSLQGNSRVKVKASVGISVITSSIYDLFASRFFGGTLSGTDGGFGSGFAARERRAFLKIIKESQSGEKSIIKQASTPLDFFSSKALQLPNNKWYAFYTGDSGSFQPSGGNLWRPDNTRFIGAESDYIDVQEGDKLYAEIFLPQEVTASEKVYSNPFTQSLKIWANEAAVRTYQYFGGDFLVLQETPPGVDFIPSITGVTASYLDTNGSASVYNYTSSYWVGFNNYSSSIEGVGSYITSSTTLANFYGGGYIQSNPGSEVYNVVNADSSAASSLGVGDAKQTWSKFGFNPIRLPFVLLPGDTIRFEFSPTKTFEIKRVISSGNVVKLQLNKQIDPSTILDNFVICRIINDGKYMILDVKKNIEQGVDQAFTGIVLPAYQSKNLEDNADELLFRLKQSGIIET